MASVSGGNLGTAELVGSVSSAALAGAVAAGSVVIHNYTITTSTITGGHRLTVTNNTTGAVQTMDVMDGDDGRGIASVALNADYTLTITYTDGTSTTTGSIRGEKGEKGEKGDKGDKGNKGDPGGVTDVRSTMDAVAVTGVLYFLGTQTYVSIVMPTDAAAGDEITVCFTSGNTACTLVCDLDGFEFVPKANTTSWLKFALYHKADSSVSGDEDQWIVDTKEG